ncbi:MAG TPA: transporter substrate-binding domain-containing protein [Bacillota bacterium]|nr:transporter substrate-binding domain-containing protein [Bacillota bacterium]
MKRNLLVSLMALLLIGLLAACGGGSDEGGEGDDGKKVLKVGTSADFPPFESFDEDGDIVGFDADLAALISEELGYELKMEDMSFDGLIGALQADRVDMVMSGMSATEERRENVDFSVDYNESSEMFITQKDSDISTLEDLDGKTVGVQLGTIQQEGAEKLKDEYNFEIKPIDDAPILIEEIKTNRIDVAYMDKDVATGFIKEQDLGGFDDPTTSSPGMAIAFPKGSDLIDEINEAIEKLQEEGKIEELQEKWLDKED